ncbi:MAG: 50S ribosomal protein L32 [bacterium]|nr:50S ribosomal protein L32 [bacterium]
MAVPKKRTPKSKKGMRRSHHGRKPAKLATCPNCKLSITSHTACPTCGMYRGRQVIGMAAKIEKTEKKRKAKARSTGA